MRLLLVDGRTFPNAAITNVGLLSLLPDAPYIVLRTIDHYAQVFQLSYNLKRLFTSLFSKIVPQLAQNPGLEPPDRADILEDQLRRPCGRKQPVVMISAADDLAAFEEAMTRHIFAALQVHKSIAEEHLHGRIQNQVPAIPGGDMRLTVCVATECTLNLNRITGNLHSSAPALTGKIPQLYVSNSSLNRTRACDFAATNTICTPLHVFILVETLSTDQRRAKNGDDCILFACQHPPRAAPELKGTWWIKEREPLLQRAATIGAELGIEIEDVLLCDHEKLVEGCSSNFFVYSSKFNAVLTSADSDCLPGSVRALVLRICGEKGIEVQLNAPRWNLRGIQRWESCWITSTSRLVQPVCQILRRRPGGSNISKENELDGAQETSDIEILRFDTSPKSMAIMMKNWVMHSASELAVPVFLE